MELTRPFARLPIRFSAEALAAECRAVPGDAWVPHPTGFKGNDAALLVTPGGRIDQGFIGPMEPTAHLANAPYIRQVMASLGCVWGRSRFMGLAPGAEVSPHVDTHYHWRTHWRLHIPVITNPQVGFTCGGETVHMQPGECWLFDSFQQHEVHNRGSEKRVHLVLDTVGGGRLHDLLAAVDGGAREPDDIEFVPPDGRSDHVPLIEKHNVRRVMSPWEIRCHLDYLLGRCQPSPRLGAVIAELDRFVDRWTGEWARWDENEEGFPSYLALVIATRDKLIGLGAPEIQMQNGLPFFYCLREIVFRMAVERPERATYPQAGNRVAAAVPG